MLASEHVSRPLVLILEHEKLTVLRVLILQVENIEGRTTLVNTAALCLDLLNLYLVRVSSPLIVHELPAFHVPIVFFDPKLVLYLQTPRLPLLLDVLEPLFVLLLPYLLVIRCEIPIEAVVVGQEVRRRGIRIVHQCVVHVLMVRPDSLTQPHLLYTLSIFLTRALLSRARLHIVVSVVELSWLVLLLRGLLILLLVLRLLLTATIVVLLLHPERLLLLLLS